MRPKRYTIRSVLAAGTVTGAFALLPGPGKLAQGVPLQEPAGPVTVSPRPAGPAGRVIVSLRPSRRVYRVTLTAYNAVPEQTDDDPEQSACGPTMREQVAVSRDLLESLPCGTRVTVVFPDGSRRSLVVNDTMNPRHSRRADVLMEGYSEAVRFGSKKGHLVADDIK